MGGSLFGSATWLAPIMQQLNRGGDVLMYADQARRQDEAQQRNALMQAVQLRQAQMQMQKQQEQENALKGAWQGLDFDAADPAKLMQAARAIGGVNPQMGIALMQKASELENKRSVERDKSEFQNEYRRDMLDLRRQGLDIQRQGLGIQQQNANQRSTVKPPPGYRVTETGDMEPIPGGPADVTNPKNRPKPPAGYRYTETGDQEVIPGGPADVKTQINIAKDTGIRDNSIADLDRLESAARELLQAPGLGRITGVMGKLPNYPGGEASNAEAKLGTLKSQIAFSVLQNMRNNSKTGGALGNVSDAEGARLENNIAALDKAQSYEEYQAQLKKIIQYTTDAKDRFNRAFALQYGNTQKAVSSETKKADDYLRKFVGE